MPSGQSVDFDGMNVLIGGNVMFENIRSYGESICSTTFPPEAVGPGRLYLDDRRAFFISQMLECLDQINDISRAINNAPNPPVNITVTGEMDMGQPVTVMTVNMDQFSMTLTGADARNIRTSQQVTYSDGILSAQGESYEIDTFFVFDESASGQREGSLYYPSSPTQVIPGPGSLYVADNKAVFIRSQSEREFINGEIVSNDFMFNTIISELVMTSIQNRQVVDLTTETKVFTIPGGSSSVSYMATGMGTAGQVTWTTSGGRVLEFPEVEMFSIYDNNVVNILNQGESTTVSTGGTMYTTGNEMMFVSNANPAAASLVSEMIPDPSDFPSAPFSITTNNKGVRLLMGTVGSMSETIQSITGSFVTPVLQSQSVNYNGNEIVIKNFNGEPVTTITEVDRLVADAGGASGEFNETTPVSFLGPGTISYSQGTAFFTTNPDLGQDISIASSTAPVPQFEFMREDIGVNEVDGVNHTVSVVTQFVGGQPVINFEASAFDTSPDQEIIYSGDVVTVHTPRPVGGGTVMYNSNLQTVTYTDTDGNGQVINGISTFSYFSGGDVTEATFPDIVTLQGPGKIYVSDDGMEAFFTSSNIITPEAAEKIRQSRPDFTIPADQFSTIVDGTFNISTEAATVAYGGGGIIYFGPDINETTMYAFYIDDEDELATIKQAVSTAFTFTKSIPAKDNDGVIRVIFNGRDIFSYSPTEGNFNVPISSTGSFNFTGNAIEGDSLPGAPYDDIRSVTVFDGISVTTFNASHAPLYFNGPGLLLVSSDTNEAFFTTSRPTIDYLIQSIAILRQYLRPPQIDTGRGSITTKDRSATVEIGTDVTAFEGADISFECKVTGRPEPSVEFFRVDPDLGIVNISNNSIVENNTLTIFEIRMGDAGEYICVASNGVEPPAIASSTLTVREAGEYITL